jgi:hypothetical protein
MRTAWQGVGGTPEEAVGKSFSEMIISKFTVLQAALTAAEAERDDYKSRNKAEYYRNQELDEQLSTVGSQLKAATESAEAAERELVIQREYSIAATQHLEEQDAELEALRAKAALTDSLYTWSDLRATDLPARVKDWLSRWRARYDALTALAPSETEAKDGIDEPDEEERSRDSLYFKLRDEGMTREQARRLADDRVETPSERIERLTREQ